MPLGTPKSETSGDIIKLTNENKVYNLKQQFLYFFLAKKEKGVIFLSRLFPLINLCISLSLEEAGEKKKKFIISQEERVYHKGHQIIDFSLWIMLCHIS